MTHYVVIYDGASYYDRCTEVVAVKHTKEEAITVFRDKVEIEKTHLEEDGWTIFEETPELFDCGIDGDYESGHALIWITEVKE